MNRIEERMKQLQEKGEKAFITYMTAGLPDFEGTKRLLKGMRDAMWWNLEFRFLTRSQTDPSSRTHLTVPSVMA